MESKIKEIVSRVLNGESTEVEDLQLIHWINEDEKNLKAYSETERLWNAVDITLNRHRFNSDKAFSDFRSKINTTGGKKRRVDSTSVKDLFYTTTRWAAIVIFLLGFGGLIGYITFLNSGRNAELCEVVVPAGSRSNIKLPDGTNVWLNANSTLKYSKDLGKRDRTVFLTGEGYFDVVRNPGKPFIVKASDIEVIALGTIFNVKSYPEEGIVQTTLIEGLVLVNRESDLKKVHSLALEPNQQLTYYKKSGEMSKEVKSGEKSVETHKEAEVSAIPEMERKVVLKKQVNTTMVTSWKDNRLVFDDESFADIATKLERRFAVRIIFSDEEVMDYRFSGRFDNISIEQALAALKFASPLFSFTIDKDTIYVTRK